MATLRLRDNFAENSWESGIAPSIEEKDSEEKKYREEKRKGQRQMPAKNRRLRTLDDKFDERKHARKKANMRLDNRHQISSIIH